jgi:transcriptional/translational regulatory protein YebC/TACO1
VRAFDKVAHALEQAGIKAESSEIAYIPTATVPVTDVAIAQSLARLHDSLEENDDVQAVFSNEEMSDELSAAAQG